MIRHTLLPILFAAVFVFMLPCFARAQSDLPTGHPPVSTPSGPSLPPQHPDTTRPPAPVDALADLPAADPEDVISIDAITSAYYDTISGPKGTARNWARFRTLFLPTATLSTTRPAGDGKVVLTITVDQFIDMNRTYFERGGYHESQISAQTNAFGSIASVFSTYESRFGSPHAKPHARGINSFQLINADGRWWITCINWASERPDQPIPTEYLPGQSKP